MLDHGAPVDITNDAGVLPLTEAVSRGFTSCVSLLLAADASMDFKNLRDRAVNKDFSDIVGLLEKYEDMNKNGKC